MSALSLALIAETTAGGAASGDGDDIYKHCFFLNIDDHKKNIRKKWF